MKNTLHTTHKTLRTLFLVLLLSLVWGANGYAQPWTYDFGTGTGTHPTNSSSTTFLQNTPVGGGTYRVRTGTAGGTMILANPGTSLGTATELQVNASTSTSTNKLGVYDWSTPSTVAYIKCKYRTTSSGNGNLNISLGINTIISDNQGFTSHYNNALASFTIVYTSGGISSIVRRISGGNQTISSSGITKDTDQLIEIYANNGSGSVNYTKSGSNTLPTKTWDLWVDGVKVVTNAATAGTLAAGTNLSGFAFFGESSASNAAFIYIDDLEYSNALPSATPTVTTQAVSAIGTTTATGNGNITATGGVNATERGVCWDLFANPDPDIDDSKNKENGDFGTGSYSIAMSSLSAETQYKVRAFATNPSGTSYGSAVNFWTLSVEPSNHSSSFTNSPQSQTQINLSYSAASTNADGYVILMKSGSAPTGVPADGVFYTEGATLGDGTIVAVVNNASATSANITGLTAGTTYHFAIFPYNKGGADATTNYKTDGTVPTTNGSTFAPLNATSEIDGPLLAGQPDPVLISSLVNTAGSAIRVFDMDMYDFGPDGQPTKITQLTIKSGTNNTANWANTIEGVKLSIDGGSTYTTIGSPTITTSSIVIPVVSGNLNIPDNDAITVSLYVYLKSSGLTDNQKLEFKVDGGTHGFLTDGTGSSFLSTFTNAPISNQILIDVVATKLTFVQQPTSCNAYVAMSPAVTVAARDANNNLDLDYSANISITSTGTLTGSPVIIAAVNGVSTFSTLTHTAFGSGITLTATSGLLTSAISTSFSISSVLLVEDFNYTVGTDLTANGWNITGTNANPYISVSAPSINYSGYLSSNIGNEVSMTVSGQDVNRIITPQNSGSVYTSFLVNVSSASTGGDYFFHVGESTIGTTFRGRVFVKKDASNNLAFGIAQSATPNYTAFSYSLNTTYLIVLKYEIVSGTANDISAIYINPTLNANIPTTGWISNTDASGTDLSGLGSIALRQGNASAPTLKLDGIRVSNTWSDIVGLPLAEPTNHATNFAAGTSTTTTIPLTWIDAVPSTQAPQNYLIKAAIAPANPTAPTEGTPEANSALVQNVAYGLENYTFTGLLPNTTYNFAIWPYTNTGAATNYKLGGQPTTSGTTAIAGYASANTGNWSDYATTWLKDGVAAITEPTSADNVTILAGHTITVGGTSKNCNNLTINNTGSLSIPAGGNLTVAGALTNNAGASALFIESDNTGSGSLLHNTDNVPANIDIYITGNSDLNSWDYHQVSIPVNMASPTSGLFTGCYLFGFNESLSTNGDWEAFGASTTSPLEINKGYLIFNPESNTAYNFSGTLRNGSISPSLSFTDAAHGFNLIPNPYPSSIDWTAIPTKTNLADAFWIWNGATNNYGAFGSEVGSGTSGTTQYIPVGQAFFVRANAASPVITLTNAARAHSTQAFLKNSASISNQLLIKAIAAGGSDEAIVAFKQEWSRGTDAADVSKMTGGENAPQLSYTNTDGNDLSINALPFSNEDVIVPLNFSLVPAGEVSFTASGMESFESSVPMYLEDLTQGKVINLREQSTYSFSHTGGDAGQRFQLRFKGVNGTQEQPAAIPGSVFVSQGNLYIDVPSMQQNTVKVSVFDALGRALSTGTHTMSGMLQIAAPGAAGVYVVRVQDGNKVFTAKVVVQ